MRSHWVAGLLVVVTGCVRVVRPPPAPIAAVPPPPPAQAPPPLAPSLPELLDGLLAPIEAGGDIVSALVIDASTGVPIYSRHEHARSLPASTLKLATTAAALAALGVDFRYHTPVFLSGSVRKHSFSGDIVLAPSGDPSFGSSRFEGTAGVCAQIAEALTQRHINQWDGSLRLQDEPGAEPRLGPGWAWDDSAYDYSAAPGAFIFHENAARLAVARAPSDRCGDELSWALDGPNGGLVATVREDVEHPGDGLVCYRRRGTRSLQCVWHHSPASCPLSGSVHVSFDDPMAALLTCLNKALRDAKISHLPARPRKHSEVHTGGDAAAMIPLVDITSPPLTELVRATNKESLNIYAERLGLEVARVVSGGGTYDALRTAQQADQQGRGINPQDLVQVDGSGLSRYNLATAAALVQIVYTSLHSPYGPALVDSLPIAGVDGTLAHHVVAPENVGRIHAKTGTLTGQRAFAGVIDRMNDTAHPRVVFALMLGNLARPVATTNDTFDDFTQVLVTAPIRDAPTTVAGNAP